MDAWVLKIELVWVVFWNSGIFSYEIDSILNCHLNLAFECFWMMTKWALVPYYEYYQGVQRSIHVSVKLWKLGIAKVGMGVNLAKVTIHLIYLFWLCLICICNLFDEMAAWNQVLNFEMIFGGFARLVLVSLQMLGFWKLILFEWVLKKWDLPIWRRFNFELSFKLCIWMFLYDHKVGLGTLLWVLSTGAKIHTCFC